MGVSLKVVCKRGALESPLDAMPSRWPTSDLPSAFQSYKPRFMKVYGAICVNKLGEVLLVRGRRSGKWSFPKGHCIGNETDLQCALRELQEETGIVLKGDYISYHKLRGASYFVFAIEEDVVPKVCDHWEIDSVCWVPLENLPRLDSNVDVSIMRSLMKNSFGESVLDFIDSPEAHKRLQTIKNNINSPRVPV